MVKNDLEYRNIPKKIRFTNAYILFLSRLSKSDRYV